MTSSSDGGPASRLHHQRVAGGPQDDRPAGGAHSLPIIMATGCRMPRSPSRDKDFATCARPAAAASPQQQPQQQQPFATTAVVLNRVSSSYPEAFFKRMSQDITSSAWFEEENDLIKSCGALQSALGLSKSFSTSDIADACAAGANADSADDGWLADRDDVRMPRSASELAINKLRINSDVLLMATTMQGRLGNASRSLSTCVVIGDMASTSQLPSPNRHSGSLLNNCAPSSAFNPTDLVRSVNKKVRQNYIQRRLLITYKTLERLSQSEFNLDKACGGDATATGQKASDRGAVGGAYASGPGKYLSVPRSGGKLLCPDDIAVCTDTIKRYQPRAFTRYDRNMFIVNWLDNIDPHNTATEDQQ